mmetsp:Transcript_2886/g.7929  ORF Transcript_2886/g.7929 Transcript_2886/m.7929 type:complete len:246 (-) Transcript_2886:1510-2247(-)
MPSSVASSFDGSSSRVFLVGRSAPPESPSSIERFADGLESPPSSLSSSSSSMMIITESSSSLSLACCVDAVDASPVAVVAPSAEAAAPFVGSSFVAVVVFLAGGGTAPIVNGKSGTSSPSQTSWWVTATWMLRSWELSSISRTVPCRIPPQGSPESVFGRFASKSASAPSPSSHMKSPWRIRVGSSKPSRPLTILAKKSRRVHSSTFRASGMMAFLHTKQFGLGFSSGLAVRYRPFRVRLRMQLM